MTDIDRKRVLVYSGDETEPEISGPAVLFTELPAAFATTRTEAPGTSSWFSPSLLFPLKGVAAPMPTYAELRRVVRAHLQRAEYEEIAALLKSPAIAELAANVVRHEVPRWERILIWRAEGAEGRRVRRHERQAREEAARAAEVELGNAGGVGGVAGDFDDGSGDTIRIPDSTDDHMDGRQPFDVEENRKWLADQQRRAERYEKVYPPTDGT